MATISQKQLPQHKLSDLLTRRQNHAEMQSGALVVLRDAFGAYPCKAKLRLGDDEPCVEFVDPAANTDADNDDATFRIDLCDVAGVHSIATTDGLYRSLHLTCTVRPPQSDGAVEGAGDDARRAVEEHLQHEDYVVDFPTVALALLWRRGLGVLLGEVEASPSRSSRPRALSPTRQHAQRTGEQPSSSAAPAGTVADPVSSPPRASGEDRERRESQERPSRQSNAVATSASSHPHAASRRAADHYDPYATVFEADAAVQRALDEKADKEEEEEDVAPPPPPQSERRGSSTARQQRHSGDADEIRTLRAELAQALQRIAQLEAQLSEQHRHSPSQRHQTAVSAGRTFGRGGRSPDPAPVPQRDSSPVPSFEEVEAADLVWHRGVDPASHGSVANAHGGSSLDDAAEERVVGLPRPSTTAHSARARRVSSRNTTSIAVTESSVEFVVGEEWEGVVLDEARGLRPSTARFPHAAQRPRGMDTRDVQPSWAWTADAPRDRWSTAPADHAREAAAVTERSRRAPRPGPRMLAPDEEGAFPSAAGDHLRIYRDIHGSSDSDAGA